ncbi:MAG: carboxypeptidase-like regulatory domain-containing protein [Candidatus Bathyarchaeia archaeon]
MKEMVVKMRKYAALFAIVSLFLSLTVISNMNVPSVRAADIFHEGDLILSGNNVTIIENQILHINGSIIITENATLIIRNHGGINFTQQYSSQFNVTLKNPANGNPRLIIENYSGIAGNGYALMLYFYGNSTLEAYQAATPDRVIFNFFDSSFANITESEFWSIYVYANAVLHMTNAWINYVFLSGNAKATISGTEIFDEISASVNSELTILNCEVSNAEACHNSKCYIYDSVFTNATLYDNARVWLFNTTITNGAVYDSSIAYLYYYLDVHVTDLVGQDVPSANVTAYDSENVLMDSKLTEIDGKARLALMKGFVNETGFYWTGAYTVVAYYMKCSNSTSVNMYGNTEIEVKLNVFYNYPASYNGDIILKDNECLCVNGLLNLNGSIIAEENATLILRDAWINFTQTSNDQFTMTCRGSARLIAENSNITSYYSFMINFEENSTATIDGLLTNAYILTFLHYSSANITNSVLQRNLYAYNYAKVSAVNCTIDRSVAVFNNAECVLSNCTINDWITITVSSANVTMANLEPGYINYWNFLENCSVNVCPTGYAPNITISETCIADGLGLSSYGSSNITIFRSTLLNLYFYESTKAGIYDSKVTVFICTNEYASCYLENTETYYLYLYGDSKVWAFNATIHTTPNISNNAKLYVGWWLNIHVIDQAQPPNDVPNANVTITASGFGTVAYGKTQSNGWAVFTLLEKIVNATGIEYEFGPYTIETDYEGYHNSATVTMNGNKEVTIILPFTIPEFILQIMLAALMALTLTTLLYKRKQNRK